MKLISHFQLELILRKSGGTLPHPTYVYGVMPDKQWKIYIIPCPIRSVSVRTVKANFVREINGRFYREVLRKEIC